MSPTFCLLNQTSIEQNHSHLQSILEQLQCVTVLPPHITQYLILDEYGLSAVIPGVKKPFQVNFDQGKMLRRATQGKELLYRATAATRTIKGYPIDIIDATAGLGREAFLLASAGARVNALEKNSAIFALTLDAIHRSQMMQHAKLTLHYDDSCHYLNTHQADVVYLDPMFPSTKKTAAVGKEAQVLQSFTHLDHTSQKQLLLHALKAARYRVVVKRPLRADPLAQHQPSSSIKGKAIRYDIYGICKIPKS